jgi:hypothetical protein
VEDLMNCKKYCLTLIAEHNYNNNDSFPITKRDKLYKTEQKETERKKLNA